MIRDELQKSQPVVYQALNNACTQNRISNAWLFTGPKGTPKKDAAYLLAMSVFCEKHEGLACETCNTCRRVKEGTYGDLVVLDGSEKAVSKEDVDAIQEKFSKTALENAEGNRVYILLHADTASVSAQNSMLKFLEEPGGKVTAILTTDNVNKLLPTIISRCTVLPFVPYSQQEILERALEQGIPEADAYLLSKSVKDPEEMLSVYEGEEYSSAVMMLKQYLNIDMPRAELLVDYDVSFRSKAKERDAAKRSNILLLELFMDFLMGFGHDVILQTDQGPSWYHNAVVSMKDKKKEYAEFIRIVSEQRDLINKYNDLNLLMDQTFWRLEEFSNGNGI